MRLKKIILGSLLSFTALVSLASCDNIFGNNNSKDSKDTQVVETTTNTATSSSETVEGKKEVEVTKKELTEAEIKNIASTVSDEKVADAITLLKEYSNTLLDEYKKLEAETNKTQNDKLTALESKIQTINTSIQNLEAKLKSNEDEIKELKESLGQAQRTRYTHVTEIGKDGKNHYEYFYNYGNQKLRGTTEGSSDDTYSKYTQKNLTTKEINNYYLKGATFKLIELSADYYFDENENQCYYNIAYDATLNKSIIDESEDNYLFTYHYLKNGNYTTLDVNHANFILVVIPSSN